MQRLNDMKNKVQTLVGGNNGTQTNKFNWQLIKYISYNLII